MNELTHVNLKGLELFQSAKLVTSHWLIIIDRYQSILSFYSKVFEKLMYNKLYNFIGANDILYAHQYGFRRGHSTDHHLDRKITKFVNSDDFVISVFIDLMKAFDLVPTNILLAKLQAYGYRGNYIK